MSQAGEALDALIALMRALRDPMTGCPWDRAQDFRSIAPYTIEEAYEVADAVGRGDMDRLRDELGDLLFQVVFHAQMAAEARRFDIADVARGIHDKLRRRHPHVFGDVQAVDVEQVHRSWEQQKARERAAAGDAGVLAGVALALPALSRAAKLGARAARVGFDWNSAVEVRHKVNEELAEIDAALAAGDGAQVAEEMGDLLFTLANWARHLQLDAEQALRQATAKFQHRFELMEQAVAGTPGALSQLSAPQWEALWQAAKARDTGS
jgi:ATP diphosphatase